MSGDSFKGLRDVAVGVVSAVATIATAAAGVLGVLHETGYLGSHASASPSVVAASAPAQNIAPLSLAPQANLPALVPAASAPAKNVPAMRGPQLASAANNLPVKQLVEVAGAWRDSGPGFCHVLKQAGHKLEIVNLGPLTETFVSVGHGTIQGREIRLQMNNLHPKAASAELYVSDDGSKLVGTIHRGDGDHPVAWHRAGTSCSAKQ